MRGHPYREPPVGIIPYKGHGWEQKASRFVWSLHVWWKGKFKDRVKRCPLCGEIYYHSNNNKSFTLFFRSVILSGDYVPLYLEYEKHHFESCEKYKQYKKELDELGNNHERHWARNASLNLEVTSQHMAVSLKRNLEITSKHMSNSMKQMKLNSKQIEAEMKAQIEKDLKQVEKDLKQTQKDLEQIENDLFK